jgi:hypothetical protein
LRISLDEVEAIHYNLIQSNIGCQIQYKISHK